MQRRGGLQFLHQRGGRPQDLQEPAWDETKEEKQRAPWAPSLPNLGSSPRATHLQMGGGAAPAPGSGRRKAELKEDGGFGLQAAVLPELAGGGGVAGGRRGRRAAAGGGSWPRAGGGGG